MGLFSFSHKNKQETTADEGEFHSLAEKDSNAIRSRGKRKQTKQSKQNSPDNQANEPVDPVLPEKKRARRRLVGAVALVLAAIIGLPMILDSEPRPLADDIAIQIPSRDKPVQPTGNNVQGLPTASVGKAPVQLGLDKNEEVIELPTSPVASAKVNQSVQPSANATSGKPEQKQLPHLKPEIKATAVTKPVEKADDIARARAILDGKPSAKTDSLKATPEKKSGKVVLQIAALASQDKVNELQGKLKDAGIKSYTQKVATQTGERIRIRIGPFASHEEADKVRAKLGKLGLNGTLVPV